MSKEMPSSRNAKPAKFGTWIYTPYQRFRLGLLSIPALEKNLALELETFSCRSQKIGEGKVELTYMKNSLETIRNEIHCSASGLVLLMNAVARSKVSNKDLTNRISRILTTSENKEVILRHLSDWGGINNFFNRALSTLRMRHARYVEAIEYIGRIGNDFDRELGEVVLPVIDLLSPGGSDEPDIVEFVGCIFKPLICAVVIVVIIVLEDEIDDDPPMKNDFPSSDPGDFPIPDPSDGVPA